MTFVSIIISPPNLAAVNLTRRCVSPPLNPSLLCLRASQFRECTINIWILAGSPLSATPISGSGNGSLSALIMVRKLSFLGGISGMPVVVDRTRRNKDRLVGSYRFCRNIFFEKFIELRGIILI